MHTSSGCFQNFLFSSFSRCRAHSDDSSYTQAPVGFYDFLCVRSWLWRVCMKCSLFDLCNQNQNELCNLNANWFSTMEVSHYDDDDVFSLSTIINIKATTLVFVLGNIFDLKIRPTVVFFHSSLLSFHLISRSLARWFEPHVTGFGISMRRINCLSRSSTGDGGDCKWTKVF